MKILFYVQLLSMGGTERTVVSLCNELVKNHEITIVQYTDTPSYFLLDSKIKLKKLGFLSNGRSKITKSILLVKQLRAEIKDSKSQVIFCMNKSHIIFMKIAKCGLKVILIGTERTNPLSEKSTRAKIDRIFAALSDGFVFQTNQALKTYPRIMRAKSCVITNAICNPDIYLNESKVTRKNEIVSVGRLISIKGFDNLILAFSKIYNQIPNYTLTIFGEGEDRQRLMNIVSKEGISDKVSLPGNNLHAYLHVKESSIFVMSSIIEGMPNSLIEALSLAILRVARDDELRFRLGENALLIRLELHIEKIAVKWLEFGKQLYEKKYCKN